MQEPSSTGYDAHFSQQLEKEELVHARLFHYQGPARKKGEKSVGLSRRENMLNVGAGLAKFVRAARSGQEKTKVGVKGWRGGQVRPRGRCGGAAPPDGAKWS